MRIILKKLKNIEEFILIITLPLMLLLVFASTCVRYFELGTMAWAEETSRYLMIWAAYAGISLGIKDNDHFGISFFVDKFKGNIKKLLFILRGILIFLFGSILLYYSIIIINNQIANHQLSPSLGIPVWLVYLSLSFCSAMMLIRVTILTVKNMKSDVNSIDGEGVDI